MNTIIESIKKDVESLFNKDSSGHDYFHTLRVFNNALNISKTMRCNTYIISLSALLHDVDDPKLFNTVNYKNARDIMSKYDIDLETQETIIEIIKNISFKGDGKSKPSSLEGQIVQDADRLDALGAIGIARAFAYGGSHNRKMYDPNIKPTTFKDEKDYHSSKGTTINHFYEKLLKLEDLMNTKEAKDIAHKRTTYLKEFLNEFFDEWDGNK